MRKRPEVVIIFCKGIVATEAELDLIDACRMFQLNIVNVQNIGGEKLEGDAIAACEGTPIPAEYVDLPSAKELWETVLKRERGAVKSVGGMAPVFTLDEYVAPTKSKGMDTSDTPPTKEAAKA